MQPPLASPRAAGRASAADDVRGARAWGGGTSPGNPSPIDRALLSPPILGRAAVQGYTPPIGPAAPSPNPHAIGRATPPGAGGPAGRAKPPGVDRLDGIPARSADPASDDGTPDNADATVDPAPRGNDNAAGGPARGHKDNPANGRTPADSNNAANGSARGHNKHPANRPSPTDSNNAADGRAPRDNNNTANRPSPRDDDNAANGSTRGDNNDAANRTSPGGNNDLANVAVSVNGPGRPDYSNPVHDPRRLVVRRDPGLQLRPMVHVDDMGASIAFYERLGAEVVHGDRESDRVLLQLGTTQIGLVACPPSAGEGECTVELNFSAAMPLDKLGETLRREGVAVVEVAGHADFGARLRVRTPDGMLIKIDQLEPDPYT
jgi:Glyoxalase/Bleomycin resistance protein/Dioxygenase superfamily